MKKIKFCERCGIATEFIKNGLCRVCIAELESKGEMG